MYKSLFFFYSKLQSERRVSLCENIFLLKEKAHQVRKTAAKYSCCEHRIKHLS